MYVLLKASLCSFCALASLHLKVGKHSILTIFLDHCYIYFLMYVPKFLFPASAIILISIILLFIQVCVQPVYKEARWLLLQLLFKSPF